MKVLCINCRKAELRETNVRLSGKFRGESYIVEMDGLQCPNCGFATVAGKAMPQFSKLLSEQYKIAHNLLTSKALINLRNKFGESQEVFAKRTGVSPASIKRYELGKIQDRHIDDQIREKTNPKVTDIGQYRFNASANIIGDSPNRSWSVLIASFSAGGSVGWTNIITEKITHACGFTTCGTVKQNDLLSASATESRIPIFMKGVHAR